jgi:hypothetical protein
MSGEKLQAAAIDQRDAAALYRMIDLNEAGHDSKET